MTDVELNLKIWADSLFPKIQQSGLYARNPTAHKWKAPFRSLMLRETVFWRLHDLLTQSLLLHQQGHGLGARILLRSAFESLATLIYLNQLMQRVIDGDLNFHTFSEKTTVLLLGSRNNEQGPKSINIITVLDKCEAQYPGLKEIYADLSESAHPSFEGLCRGYSKSNHDEYETVFSNRWMELYGKRHLDLMELCMSTFHNEYDKQWLILIEKLENWTEANDEMLESTKNDQQT